MNPGTRVIVLAQGLVLHMKTATIVRIDKRRNEYMVRMDGLAYDLWLYDVEVVEIRSNVALSKGRW